MKPKRRLAPAAVLVLAALAGCASPGVGGPPVTVAEATQEPAATAPDDVAHGSWEPVARSPLSARNNAVTAWTGKEVLVFGGEMFYCGGPMHGSFPCAAPANPPLRDGAAYDPKADTWRRIARAPVPMLYASTAVIGDTVFVLAGKDFFAYDVPDDKWRRLPASPTRYASLVAIGDLLVAYRQTTELGEGSGEDYGDRDHYWDAAEKEWRALPPTPKRPVFERTMTEVDGVGILVGRPPNSEGNYSSSGLAAVELDPDTLRWRDLRFAKARNGGNLVSYFPQPVHAADGKIVTASFYGDKLGYGRSDALVGGILDLDEGWSRLPARPLSAAERKARAEAKARVDALIEKNGPNSGMPAGTDQPRIEAFSWLNVGGDGFVVAGRWALDVARGTWQHVPVDAGPVQLFSASAVWAGDRVFVWGGSKGHSENVAEGWTWRPSRPGVEATIGVGR